ncbi:hypothetical protein [Mariniblastus fucicola]|uniref:hypothetical protein n=1 Tax=Mariniblastus fucicola TaxID=980251 RepID=UPI0012F9A453|nr:hypothetical protein [Mariniblastus fucicola]
MKFVLSALLVAGSFVVSFGGCSDSTEITEPDKENVSTEAVDSSAAGVESQSTTVD